MEPSFAIIMLTQLLKGTVWLIKLREIYWSPCLKTPICSQKLHYWTRFLDHFAYKNMLLDRILRHHFVHKTIISDPMLRQHFTNKNLLLDLILRYHFIHKTIILDPILRQHFTHKNLQLDPILRQQFTHKNVIRSYPQIPLCSQNYTITPYT